MCQKQGISKKMLGRCFKLRRFVFLSVQETLNEIHHEVKKLISGREQTPVDLDTFVIFPPPENEVTESQEDEGTASAELTDVDDFHLCRVMKNIEIAHFDNIVDTMGKLVV